MFGRRPSGWNECTLMSSASRRRCLFGELDSTFVQCNKGMREQVMVDDLKSRRRRNPDMFWPNCSGQRRARCFFFRCLPQHGCQFSRLDNCALSNSYVIIRRLSLPVSLGGLDAVGIAVTRAFATPTHSSIPSLLMLQQSELLWLGTTRIGSQDGLQMSKANWS